MALCFTACPNAAGGGIAPPASDKTYNVSGVSFTMKAIAVVTEGELGSTSETNNVVHKVNLKAYSICKTEVTQEL